MMLVSVAPSALATAVRGLARAGETISAGIPLVQSAEPAARGQIAGIVAKAALHDARAGASMLEAFPNAPGRRMDPTGMLEDLVRLTSAPSTSQPMKGFAGTLDDIRQFLGWDATSLITAGKRAGVEVGDEVRGHVDDVFAR
jgi:hypothetical protein